MIYRSSITSKNKANPTLFVSPEDFTTEGEGLVDKRVILESPNVSIYCLDDINKRAIFVETPDINIEDYPFFYQAQYEQAQNLITVPYDTLIELGKEVAGSEKQLVFVHSVGRSGSTLMSKAFQEIDTVLSLSEPDIYTQVVGLRDTMPDERLKALLKASTQLLFKPSFARDSQYWVLKFRSFCIEIADLLSETFPTSKSLFLYRNLDNYITSGARAFRIFDPGSTEWMSGEDPNRPKYIPLLLGDPERKYNSYNPIEFITLMWLSVMDKYLQLRRQGINMEAVKYEDLVRNPEGTMRLLLNNLGFSNTDVQKALLAFTKDSQAGSVLSRENLQDIIIPSTSMDEAQDLLDRHDEIRDGTYTLPGTIES